MLLLVITVLLVLKKKSSEPISVSEKTPAFSKGFM